MKHLLISTFLMFLICLFSVNDSYSAFWTISQNVSGCGGISPAGDRLVADGGSITFTITPDADCYTRYLVADNSAQFPATTYTFTNVQADQKIEAIFAPVDFMPPHVLYDVFSSSIGGGSITPEGLNTYNYPVLSFYTFAPETGYQLSDVKVDGVSIGVVPYYYFVDESGAHTLEAFFAVSYSDPVLLSSSTGSSTAIQNAYDMAIDPDTIKVKAGDQLEDGLTIQFDRDVAIRLEGGYDDIFSTVTSTDTEYSGTFIIRGGSVDVSDLIIK